MKLITPMGFLMGLKPFRFSKTFALATTEKLDWMDSETRVQWPNLHSLIVVENQTAETATGRKRRAEERDYLSSLPANAGHLRETIRAHWGIENSCHWKLDRPEVAWRRFRLSGQKHDFS